MKNANDVIYSPSSVSEKTVASIMAEKAHPEYLSLGIQEFGNEFVMARKSKVIGLLGDTSQGKTSLMRYIANTMAEQINYEHNEIGLYVTWEDNVEDFGMADFANISKISVKSLYNGQVNEAEFSRMLGAAVKRAATPLWLAGHSEVSSSRPMLTMTDIFAVCDNLVNVQGKKLRFIMLDYLQRISREDTGERDTRMQFVKIMDKIKDLSLTFGACVFVGSQVRRDLVEKGKWRQPQMHWAQETSNFEHSCDGMLSVWMPYMSKDIWKLGDLLDIPTILGESPFTVTKELMGIEILKQKKGGTGILRFVDFIPEYGMFVKRGDAGKIRMELKSGTFKN